MLFRFSYVWRLRFTARQPQQTPVFRQIVEIEAERGELVTAFRRDLVHRPTRLPGPVDAEFFDETGEGAGAFVFDQVGQRAGRRGERHRDDGSAQFVDFDAVNQTKVDDVDAEFRSMTWCRASFTSAAVARPISSTAFSGMSSSCGWEHPHVSA